MLEINQIMSIVLLGDSILKRLYAKFSKDFHPLSELFCVSGQRILELKDIVRSNGNRLKGLAVVVMIGTNDVLGGTPLSDMKLQYKSLLKLLKYCGAEVCVLEVLPVPRFAQCDERNKTVVLFNKYVHSFQPGRATVIDCYDSFLLDDGSINTSFYCKWIGRYRRMDLVHPNFQGLKLLCALVLRCNVE